MSDHADLWCKVYAPSSIQKTFKFKLTGANADGTYRGADVQEFQPDDEYIVDDGTMRVTCTVENGAYSSDGIAHVTWPTLEMPSGSTLYYILEVVDEHDADVNYDKVKFLVKVDNSAHGIEYYLYYQGDNYGQTTDYTFYNSVPSSGEGEVSLMTAASTTTIGNAIFASVRDNGAGTFSIELLLDDQEAIPIRVEDGKRYFAVRLYLDSQKVDEFMMYEGQSIIRQITYTSSVGANLSNRIFGLREASNEKFYGQKLTFIPGNYVLFVNNCNGVFVNDCIIEGVGNGVLVSNSVLTLTDCEIRLRNGYNDFITKQNSNVTENNVTKTIRLG